MKAVPQIQKFMTTTPHSVGSEQSLRIASELMKKHDIRHLPVLHEGKLAGIITDRDVKLALGIQGVDPDETKVDQIATEDPYLTAPGTPADEVVIYMAEHKIGSALVVDNHKLVGIFTSTDALRVLGEVLHQRH